MDTLGKIVPATSQITGTRPRTEVLERLRYLAHRDTCGVLSGGPGAGKSALLGKLAGQLRREGCSVIEINLNGVDGEELPHLLAARLGLGISLHLSQRSVWALLTEYASGRSLSRSRLVLILDHLDRADASVLAALDRAMQVFSHGCGWLVSARSNVPAMLKSFVRERAWLRVELKELTSEESAQVLARELAGGAAPVHMTPEAADFTVALARGRVDRLQQLAELASLAAQAEGIPVVGQEQLAAITEELLV